MKSRAQLLGAVCAAIFLAPGLGIAATQIVSVEDAEKMAIEFLESARASLENANPDAKNDPKSRLALGIVLYRLGQASLASKTLKSLYGTVEEHQAKYYLAKIAEARGDYGQAKRLYGDAANQYQNLTAQERADNALLALLFGDWKNDPRQSVSNRDFAYVSGKTKAVDGLVNPDDSSAVDGSDVAFDLLLAGSKTIWSPDDQTNWRIGASLFREDYIDFSEYDLQMIRISTQLERSFGRNLLKLQLESSDISLGGEDYLGYTDVSLSDNFSVNNDWDLRITGLYRDVSSENAAFDHYNGSVMQASLEIKGRLSNPWQFDYTYRVEDLADRILQFTNDDSDIFDGFLSYSRDYHRIRGRYDLNWNERLSQAFSGSIRSTVYADSNVYLESTADTALTEAIRKGFRYTIGSELSWSLTDRLRLLGEVEYVNEDSNIDQYDFNSMQFGLGLDYIF